jgi:NitT/TauT family transport system substrate-binding protein
VLKDRESLAHIKGLSVNLVELSVSHYLLARGLDSVGLSEPDITVVNTSDADIVAAFNADAVQAAVFWNPQLSEALAMPGSVEVFDSSDIPGEIIDMMVVNTQTLAANPALGKALTGAWYEIMSTMAQDDEAAKAARSAMGQAAGTDLAGYDSQLQTTQMFYDPAAAVTFTNSPGLIQTMDHVRQFSFNHGLLGEGAPDADIIGMAFPGGQTLGDSDNIKLRFSADYMQMAADGAL